MASTKIDYDKAARILVDAAQLGPQKAAEKHGITDKTVRNYRRRLETDEELSAAFRRLSAGAVALFQIQQAQAELGWRQEHHAALRRGMQVQQALFDRVMELAPKITDAKELKELIVAVGRANQGLIDSATAQEALGVGDSDGPQGAGPQAPARDDAGGEAEAGPVQH